MLVFTVTYLVIAVVTATLALTVAAERIDIEDKAAFLAGIMWPFTIFVLICYGLQALLSKFIRRNK